VNAHRRRSAVRFHAVALALLVSVEFPPAATRARTVTWTATVRDLEEGTADAVALSSRGVLFPAPHLQRVGGTRLPAEPGQIWSLVADALGTLYLGTGPGGHVLKLPPAGKASVHFRAEEPLVTALAIDAEGALLAGTAPGGRIYRIARDGKGAVWSETGERYVWAIAIAQDGTVYAGTGERGRVLRIGRSGSAEPLFDGADTHVVALGGAVDGAILAGGAGRGLVHRIERSGMARVLFQTELPEVAALAGEPDGSVLAALVGASVPDYQPPAVLIQLPDGTSVGQSEGLGALDDESGPVLRGSIEGLPSPGLASVDMPRGGIVRVRQDGRIESLWSSRGATPFCVLPDEEGRAWFGTGEPARLYRLDATGDVALLATLPEAQITRMARAGRTTFVATSNPAAVYRIDGPRAEPPTFVSRPVDAGGVSRWGVMRWTFESGAASAELSTRAGNSRDPDGTWSDWGPALLDPRGSHVPSPDGRYLQWRVRFPGSQNEGARIRDLSLRYEPYNRPPEIRGFRLDGGEAAVALEALFRWEAYDPDGDPIHVRLEYRTGDQTDWSRATWDVQLNPNDEPTGWHDERRTWNTSSIAEGRYEVRAFATDAAAHPPGTDSPVPASDGRILIIDRSAPRIDWKGSEKGLLRFIVQDDHSDIRRVELVADGEVRAALRAQDGVCDSRTESFELRVPPDLGSALLRAVDAAGNRVEAALPEPP